MKKQSMNEENIGISQTIEELNNKITYQNSLRFRQVLQQNPKKVQQFLMQKLMDRKDIPILNLLIYSLRKSELISDRIYEIPINDQFFHPIVIARCKNIESASVIGSIILGQIQRQLNNFWIQKSLLELLMTISNEYCPPLNIELLKRVNDHLENNILNNQLPQQQVNLYVQFQFVLLQYRIKQTNKFEYILGRYLNRKQFSESILNLLNQIVPRYEYFSLITEINSQQQFNLLTNLLKRYIKHQMSPNLFHYLQFVEIYSLKYQLVRECPPTMLYLYNNSYLNHHILESLLPFVSENPQLLINLQVTLYGQLFYQKANQIAIKNANKTYFKIFVTYRDILFQDMLIIRRILIETILQIFPDLILSFSTNQKSIGISEIVIFLIQHNLNQILIRYLTLNSCHLSSVFQLIPQWVFSNYRFIEVLLVENVFIPQIIQTLQSYISINFEEIINKIPIISLTNQHHLNLFINIFLNLYHPHQPSVPLLILIQQFLTHTKHLHRQILEIQKLLSFLYCCLYVNDDNVFEETFKAFIVFTGIKMNSSINNNIINQMFRYIQFNQLNKNKQFKAFQIILLQFYHYNDTINLNKYQLQNIQDFFMEIVSQKFSLFSQIERKILVLGIITFLCCCQKSVSNIYLCKKFNIQLEDYAANIFFENVSQSSIISKRDHYDYEKQKKQDFFQKENLEHNYLQKIDQYQLIGSHSQIIWGKYGIKLNQKGLIRIKTNTQYKVRKIVKVLRSSFL